METRARFQSTPPRRRRLRNPETGRNEVVISIHASAKEATGNHPLLFPMYQFQSTPPRRRRLLLRWYSLKNQWKFQSTPPRRRRLRNPETGRNEVVISIHASAKEATGNHPLLFPMYQFQSTPPRRRRLLLRWYSLKNQWKFQSTPPRRRRPLFN